MVSSQRPVGRWQQFKLRALLACMLGLSVFFGVLGRNIHTFRDQERRIADLAAHHAHIFYKHQIDGSSEPPGPAMFKQLLGDNLFGKITYLALHDYDQPVTDAVFALVAQFEELEHLSLDDTEINDDQLPYISRLTKLKTVQLVGTRITNAGLAHLHGLKNLTNIYLHETQVTEDGIRKLRRALPTAEVHSDGTYIRGGII